MLYTLEGDELGFSVKKKIKKATKKATKTVQSVAKSPVVAKVVAIAKKPEVLTAAAAAAGTAVGIPPQATIQAIQTVQQAKTTYEDIKNNPIAKQALIETIQQKGDKVIKPEELDLLFEKYEEAKKYIVKKQTETMSVAKIYWEKGELI